MSPNHYFMPLPRQAGYIVTSIGGKKCTAVPRSVQQPSKVATTTQPAQTTAAPPAKTTENTNNNPGADAGTTALRQTTPSSNVNPEPVVNPIQSIVTPLISIPTPEAISDTSISQSSRRPLQTPLSPGDTNKDTGKSDPQDSSSARVPLPTASNGNHDPSNTDGATVVPGSGKSANTGAIVGSVLGILIVLAILGILLFFCRKRRKQKKQEAESLLSPLPSSTREKFYEIDTGSLGPSKKTTKWKQEISSRAENAAYGFKMTMADIGETFRDTVSRDRSRTPSLDLNRGHSQFYPASNVGLHSRNNSIVTLESKRSSLRERFAKWRGRFGEVWQPQKQGDRMRSLNSHTTSMAESLGNNQERYRDSDQSGSVTTSNLGLTLMNSQTSELLRLENQPRDPFEDPYADEDPFRDPKMEAMKALRPTERPLSNPFDAGDNPFSDPVITIPTSTIPKPQTYIQHVRRSRGSSFSSVPSSNRSSRNSDLISFVDQPTSMTVTSPRNPSFFAPSHASDRDTIYSSFSAERRGKGRSDPFDLDRADFYSRLSPKNRPKPTEPNLENSNGAAPSVNRIKSMIDQNKARNHHRYDSSIRYSSGVDSLEEWGEAEDCRQDSMRGNASSRASARDFDKNGVRHGRADSEVEVEPMGIMPNHRLQGSLVDTKVNFGGNGNDTVGKEIEQRRERDNVSPVSAISVEVRR